MPDDSRTSKTCDSCGHIQITLLSSVAPRCSKCNSRLLRNSTWKELKAFLSDRNVALSGQPTETIGGQEFITTSSFQDMDKAYNEAATKLENRLEELVGTIRQLTKDANSRGLPKPIESLRALEAAVNEVTAELDKLRLERMKSLRPDSAPQKDQAEDGDSQLLTDLKDKIVAIDRRIAAKEDEMSSYGLSEAGVFRKQREKDALVLQRQDLLHKAALQESRERGERAWRDVNAFRRLNPKHT